MKIDFKTWSENALAGSCHLCTLLFYAAAGPQHQLFINTHPGETHELAVNLSGTIVDRNEGNFKYLAVATKLSPDSQRVKRLKQLEKSIGASTVTAETINQVLQWMDMCSTQHKICQQYQNLVDDADDLPLRLIDVDPKGEYLCDEKWKANIDTLSCDKATHACIRYSQEAKSTNPNGVKYLTLSNRWDSMAPTVLTWENMAAFEEQIPVSNLFIAFKDAIQITRCLSFRYICIDSICINQTDTVERASEISRMERIYRNSELNLSATTGETGLNLPRNPKSDLQTVIIPKNWDRFIQLEVATLRLQVTVIPVERDWRNGASKMRLLGHNNWYTESHDFIIGGPPPPILSFIRLKWDTTDILRADDATSARRKLFMVPIAVAKGTTWLGGESYRTPTIKGLILQRLPGRGQYNRVGMFMTGNLNDGCNPKLAQRIFQHLPMQSFTKFYEKIKKLKDDTYYGRTG
ncbi:heterokaryon incompatibility protein [Colletotrichum sojae]|uniref:Heterokaryon incompatibility protein n=1 Tax=Colletotrichum sojae TaxID=2175907 RepID=A0A8H6JHQ5_9PEZI|nr:heterokaryon incompatibility protein [Colletotrichum sojae]